MDGSTDISSQFSAISLVMSYDSQKAFEIQFDNSDITNPYPKRILDYRANSDASVTTKFKNTDYRKVLGISSKSMKRYSGTYEQHDIFDGYEQGTITPDLTNLVLDKTLAQAVRRMMSGYSTQT